MSDARDRLIRLERLALERADRPHWHPSTTRRRRPWWPWLVVLAFLAGVVIGAAVVSAAEPAVTIHVRPQIMIRRGDIRVEVRVPRHTDNRMLAIAWISDVGTAGSTVRPLEGEDALVMHVLALPSQPAANYFFTASVFGSSGKLRGRVEARILAPDDRVSFHLPSGARP